MDVGVVFLLSSYVNLCDVESHLEREQEHLF